MATTNVIHGFELVRDEMVPEINSRARLFRHVKTGAELLSLENDDENKVFSIAFRTPPHDSTGVAHIMEHSVLCGSRKYPLKEPFVELLKGSLKTFLNAMTYSDKTVYPVASQNVQDFYNLVDVYLDAVLYPLIPPQVLEQEGWHYELDDPTQPLAFKGVVFNEMKGAYSSPDNLLGRYSQQALFPDNTYGVDSGGDPSVIPDLTYADFKHFHDTYYHPSNARIAFYGDDDPEERLRIVDGYLRDFERLDVDSDVPLQAPFQAPLQMVRPYTAGEGQDGEAKAYITLNWALRENDDPTTTLGLQILGHILTGTPASPLRKALIESGLGEDLTPSGLDEDLRQIMYSTGLKGIAREKADEVQVLILHTLEALAQNGIDPEMVAASMNTVEFRRRENNTGSFPRGLAMILNSLTSWMYEQDPLQPLRFEAPLAEIQQRLARGERYFESLIEQYLLRNSHRATVILEPDPELGRRQEAAERLRLDQVRAGLSETDLQQIVENTRRLKLHQETPDSPEALATIPSLKLADLDPKVKTIPLAVEQTQGMQLLYHDLFTNGIVYLDLGFNLHVLPEALLPYVPLFGRALLEMGAGDLDYVRLAQRIGRTTGGIRPVTFTSAVRGKDTAQAWLFLRGKATAAQAPELLNILNDVLTGVRLDNQERFRQMVLDEKAGLESSLAPAGHQYVNARLRSYDNEADWASEQMEGVSSLFFLRQLAQEVESNWPVVLERLERLRGLLLNRQAMLANVTLDEKNWATFRPQLEGFLSGLPSAGASLAVWQGPGRKMNEGLSFPAQVNYVGQGANLYRLGYELSGAVQAVNLYLRTTFLWERVRVQGGAYGGFCAFDARSGVFTFLSYRDPNLLKTLDNYQKAAEFLRSLELSEEELTKSIIGAIGEMDAYQLPDAKGYTSMLRYLLGEDDDYRQRLRQQLLGARAADFHQLGQVLSGIADAGQVVVLGSPDAIQKANQEKNGFLEVTKVL